MASLVLTDSSQLTADGFEKLPDQIMYPYAEPYDRQKNMYERDAIQKKTFTKWVNKHLKKVKTLIYHLFCDVMSFLRRP
uniref:Calponin-homology (CH) domain-containing protein n=1 Tax=Timema tahoe TaxID=61484 RepID=A0A7R9NUJ4_9NEOP|nr:unnamed protein product [Timema tahoe]